jgi:hypothetical protein
VSELRTTTLISSVALALLVVTWATTPQRTSSDVLTGRGDLLFPQFRDPNAAASLELTEFDARTATARPFKVQNRNGRWTIPSAHNYPADGGGRLANIAATLIALRKDDVASENAADYERCDVLDPLDTRLPNVMGRGTRVVVRGAHDEVLADVILGKQVAGHPGFRYVRVPDQKRVYSSNIGDLRVSSAFADWIDRDVLQVQSSDIDAVNLRNYALDRSTGRVEPGETLLLQHGKDNAWTLNGLESNERVDLNKVSALLDSLTSLTITGVLPKPAGINATLSQEVSRTSISVEDRADLARKGFYLAPNGQLVSNRGEVVVKTNRGLYYTLRFGDIAPGAEASTNGANRYLFIMVDFDPSSAKTPGLAAEGAGKARLLRVRFAPWYYIIAADSIKNIRLGRTDLIERVAPRTSSADESKGSIRPAETMTVNDGKVDGWMAAMTNAVEASAGGLVLGGCCEDRRKRERNSGPDPARDSSEHGRKRNGSLTRRRQIPRWGQAAQVTFAPEDRDQVFDFTFAAYSKDRKQDAY